MGNTFSILSNGNLHCNIFKEIFSATLLIFAAKNTIPGERGKLIGYEQAISYAGGPDFGGDKRDQTSDLLNGIARHYVPKYEERRYH